MAARVIALGCPRCRGSAAARASHVLAALPGDEPSEFLHHALAPRRRLNFPADEPADLPVKLHQLGIDRLQRPPRASWIIPTTSRNVASRPCATERAEPPRAGLAGWRALDLVGRLDIKQVSALSDRYGVQPSLARTMDGSGLKPGRTGLRMVMGVAVPSLAGHGSGLVQLLLPALLQFVEVQQDHYEEGGRQRRAGEGDLDAEQ